MQRFLVLIYGAISYVIFFATFLYAIGFVGNLWVPKSIDSAPQVPLAQALLINLALLALFAVQHAAMTRPLFKSWIVRFIPKAAERSTHVLASSLSLLILFRFWEPMGGVVWNISSEAGQILMHCAFLFGWLLLLARIFLINHFDLFGLRQVWLNLRNKPYTEMPLVTPFVHRLAHSPVYLGCVLAFSATSTMTVAHLVFAIAITAYVYIMIQLETQSLIDTEREYADFCKCEPVDFEWPELIRSRQRNWLAAKDSSLHSAYPTGVGP